MIKRDILQAEIEQLGKVLGKGLALILGIKTAGAIPVVFDQLINTLSTELGIDLKQWLGLNQEEFERTLKEALKDNEQVLQQLGDLLFEMGKGCALEGELRQQYLEKALWTFNYINQISVTFSMERLHKIRAIKNSINE